MSNRCGNCRFFNGSKCNVQPYSVYSTKSACADKFSVYGRDSVDNVKKCGDCRFFNGSKCGVTGYLRQSNNSSCSAEKAICK